MISKRPRVLVVGMGVAGMSAAIAARQAGWEPVIVERASERRRGGYSIGLFGTGKAAAERLGVRDAIHTRTPARTVTWEVDRHGNRRRGVGFLEQPGQPASALRGDVEEALFGSLGDLEIRYSTIPIAIVDAPDGAEVTLRGPGGDHIERFDLVVGADGMRSTVRELVFAPATVALRPMGTMICTFKMQRQVDYFADDEGIVLAEPGRSLWVFPLSDHAPTALFSFRAADINSQFARPPIDIVRGKYTPPASGQLLGQVLEQFEAADDYLFDSVNQVKLGSWHRGRVLLLGDAAWCVTLYAGMGVSAGMAGAALLGDLLARHPSDIGTALSTWESRMRPFVAYHQRWAHFNGQFFTPSNRIAHSVRSLVMLQGGKRVQRRPGRSNTMGRRMAAMRNIDLVDAVPAR